VSKVNVFAIDTFGSDDLLLAEIQHLLETRILGLLETRSNLVDLKEIDLLAVFVTCLSFSFEFLSNLRRFLAPFVLYFHNFIPLYT